MNKVFLIVIACIFVSGCATQRPMALSGDAKKTIAPEKTILLMTATLKNAYKTSYQPKLIVANIEKDGGKTTEDRLNFKIDDLGKVETDTADAGNQYLLRMEVDKGDYVARGMMSIGTSFPFTGIYFVPMHAKIDAKTPGVYYLGHVDATIRERKENEFKAGPSIPLIDQALAGASTGTFDVEISDRWETDQEKFIAKFPVISSVTVQKAILPPFDRAKAQQWWEAN